MKTKRNGKIELLRFIFCMTVVFFHINTYLFKGKLTLFGDFKFFHFGYIGVEFFFLLSGFLLAKSALKRASLSTDPLPAAPGTLGSETVSFIKGKVMPLMAPHTIAFVLCFITVCIIEQINGVEIISALIKAVPGYLFFNKTGISSKNINGVEWYIGCMLLSMVVIYPLCRKYTKLYTNVFAPILGIFILGFILHNYSSVANVKVYAGFMYKCQLRAFAEINLGVSAFAVSEKLKTLNFSKGGRIAVTVAEAILVIYVLLFSTSSEKSDMASYAILALYAAVVIIFSDVSYGKALFDNKFFLFLGKLSLPIYMIQLFAIRLYQIVLPQLVSRKLVTTCLVTLFVLVSGVLLYFASKPLDKLLNKTIEKLNGKAPAQKISG